MLQMKLTYFICDIKSFDHFFLVNWVDESNNKYIYFVFSTVKASDRNLQFQHISCFKTSNYKTNKRLKLFVCCRDDNITESWIEFTFMDLDILLISFPNII